MARINLLEQTKRKAKKQGTADADYLFLKMAVKGFFQLVSYGSPDREFPKSASQKFSLINRRLKN